jgi:hypothetical protein
VANSETRVREIGDTDTQEVAHMLGRGLGYAAQYFLEVFSALAQHSTPTGFPKYGYLLEHRGRIVGAIVLIFSEIETDDDCVIRCNLTSWYVDEKYRYVAALFFSKALGHKNVSYMNVSARPATIPIIEIQGFSKYSNGQFVSVPALHLCSGLRDRHIKVVAAADTVHNIGAERFEQDLLAEHAKLGCLSVWCITPERAYPFVFHKRFFKGFLPGAQLAYCSDVTDFVHFVQPLGLFLASHGIFFVRIDSNGPVSGLIGKYFDGIEPRFYKGLRPRLGDLAYTQNVMCRDPRSLRFKRGDYSSERL